MSAAFKAPIKATPKLVLLALCDCANDQGECYPSVPTLMEKCSAGERTIQDALTYLDREGYLRRDFRTGRSTVYWIADPRTWRTPAAAAPPQIAHPTPAVPAPPPPQQPHPTPADAAPITIKEPSVEPSRKPKTAGKPSVSVGELMAEGFSEELAAEFIAHKAELKAPLTARAWADHLAESRKAGWSPVKAAEKVLARSWKGFEAAYVANEPRQTGQAGQPAETTYARQMRERYEQIAPGVAAKRPGAHPFTIDMEPTDGTPLALG